jgi:hypothetical protein
MRFRLKVFGLHLACSAFVLGAIVGALYLGWYRWPGWYLADAAHVVAVLVGVDLVIGPTATMIVASSKKPRRVLARDVAAIVTVQLAALLYGASALWHGRPLYYAFSVDCLQVVQAYDIDREALGIARRQKAALLPHWYSLPRWIWAPLPADPEEARRIVASVLRGGPDVIGMPQYYKPWKDGVAALRAQLKNVDDVGFFSVNQKKALKERMRASGLPTDQPDAIPLTGRGPTLLAVMDPSSLKIRAIIKAT